MRLWTFHPSYLDKKGLQGLWYDSIVVQGILKKLINGEGHCCKNHPCVKSFLTTEFPLKTLSTYMQDIILEGEKFNINFDRKKILENGLNLKLFVNKNITQEEISILMERLKTRSPEIYNQNSIKLKEEILLNSLYI